MTDEQMMMKSDNTPFTNESLVNSPTTDNEFLHAQINALKKQVRELSFLHETSRLLTSTLDVDSVLQAIMNQVRDYFLVEAASVALLDERSETLIFRVAVGKASQEVIGLRLLPGQGVAGWVAQTGRAIIVPTAHEDERFYSVIDDQTDFYTHTMLAVPIQIEGRTIGVIEAINPASGEFDPTAQRLVTAVADLAAVAIRNAALYERVRQTERQYESLFNESADPIIVLDLEGRIINLNRQAIQLLNRPRTELIGNDIYTVMGLDLEVGQQIIEQAQPGCRFRAKLHWTPPGEVESHTIEMYATRINYGGREAIQWVGRDITERIALEQMREDLTHMIIHDLRNPLGSITSSLQLIRTALAENDDTLPLPKLVDIAIRSSQKLYRLIDSLLDVGRLETGEAGLIWRPIDPARLVREAVEQIQPMIISHRQRLTVNMPSNLPPVEADEDMILRVLTNLLDNAIKFNSSDGQITLDVSLQETGRPDEDQPQQAPAAELLFSVSDTGPGIPSEFQQRIFERFARLETTAGVKGSGLGLTFCKLAVEAHKGRIWIESEVGKGSTFHFTLPLKHDESRTTSIDS